MSESLGNIYKMARKASGLIQEVASDYLKISTETLSKYENGKVVPEIKTVAKMCHIYDTPWLMVQHVELHDVAAQMIYPKIPIKQFGLSVLNLLSVLDELDDEKKKRLIKIASNNKIDDTEWGDWLEVSDMLNNVSGAILGVIHSKKDKD